MLPKCSGDLSMKKSLTLTVPTDFFSVASYLQERHWKHKNICFDHISQIPLIIWEVLDIGTAHTPKSDT